MRELTNNQYKGFCQILQKLSAVMYDVKIDKGRICQFSDDRILNCYVNLSNLIGDLTCSFAHVAKKLPLMQLLTSPEDRIIIDIKQLSETANSLYISDTVSDIELLIPDDSLLTCPCQPVEQFNSIVASANIKIAEFDLTPTRSTDDQEASYDTSILKKFINSVTVLGLETYSIEKDQDNQLVLTGKSVDKVRSIRICKSTYEPEPTVSPLLEKFKRLIFSVSIGVFDSAPCKLEIVYSEQIQTFLAKYTVVPYREQINENTVQSVDAMILTKCTEQ